MSTYQIIDANLNRACEGLRVLEDLSRFSQHGANRHADLKNIRHALRSCFSGLENELIQSRCASSDGGRTLEAQGEMDRPNHRAVVAANAKRAQEAIRVLEEQGKMVLNPESVKTIESCRYQVYDLEQELLLSRTWPKPCLYVLITQSLCKKDPLEIVREVCEAGASVIQLREKDMEDGAFLMWIREVKAITDTYDVPLIINDRIHLALLTGAQGVHMGQGDLPTAEAKRLLAPWQWLGRSTHGMHQAQPAVEEGLDYLGVGPLYLTQTKEHREAVGLGYMRQVEDELDIPYVGIGAVNRKNLPAILVEKPTGLAICTAIIGHDDPKGETAFYLEQMKQALL